MNNNKGFTLIELLAMITVIAILMAITIPNITGILNNSRLNVIKNDAKNMIEKAKVKVSTTSSKKARENYCIIFSLNYLNDNNDIGGGTNGGTYNSYESFVVYTRIGQKYKYYVRLVEETSDGKYGFNVIDAEDIRNLKNSNITTINDNLGLSNNVEESKAILNNNKPKIGYGEQTGTTLCSNGVEEYY